MERTTYSVFSFFQPVIFYIFVQIEALEARNQEISEELRMAHEGNINQSNQAISRLQRDKERLEVSVL